METIHNDRVFLNNCMDHQPRCVTILENIGPNMERSCDTYVLVQLNLNYFTCLKSIVVVFLDRSSSGDELACIDDPNSSK